MKFPLTVCVFLLTVIRSLSVDITVRGMEGEPVIIKCPYPGGYENSYKYFFKGVYRESVIILQSNGGKSMGRFSLQDDRQTRSFTVTISDLKMEDAGLYGCGAGAEHYKEVNLIVLRALERTRPVQISTSSIRPYTNTSTERTGTEHTSTEDSNTEHTSTEHSKTEHIEHTSTGHTSTEHSNTEHTDTEHTSTVTHQETETTRTRTGNTTVGLYQPNNTMRTDLVYVAGGVTLVLLVLCSGTLLILKMRKRKCGTALFQKNVQHNTETDHIYEEIPNSDGAVATSSSSQTSASHLNICPKVFTVYTTITDQLPDSNLSHTYSTNQVTDCSPDPTEDSRTERIYVTATHPQNITTNEGPIYSIINDE